MLFVQVDVKVRPESVDAFKQATLTNARASLKEPGVARFDLVQDQADPCHFLLLEVYRSTKAPAEHKQTSHYQTWRDTVEGMMARPRRSAKYDTLHPADPGWETAGALEHEGS